MAENPPKNILELIAQSTALPEVGHGQEANVYPVAGMPEYVLRVRDDAHWEYEMNETSSLTPVNYGYGTRALGPALLQGGGLSIHPRQPGMSLTVYWEKLSKEYQADSMPRPAADAKAY